MTIKFYFGNILSFLLILGTFVISVTSYVKASNVKTDWHNAEISLLELKVSELTKQLDYLTEPEKPNIPLLKEEP